MVGGGAAGLSAALVLGRARRRTLVVDAGGQSNLPSHGIGGLLGHDGLAPADLYRRGRAELAAYSTVQVRDGRVVGVVAVEDGFVLTLEDGREERAARVLLATGMDYGVPDLPGVRELWGGAVFHCPYCHGWEVRDGALAVLGREAAVHRALLLRGWSADVVLLSDGPAGLDDEERGQLQRAGIPIEEREVVGVRARGDELEAVLFADGSELLRDGILAFDGFAPRASLARDLGAALTEQGGVDVDEFGQTTVRGLFAAGDVRMFMPQITSAIAEGARAAAMVNGSLVAERFGVPPMVPPRAA